MLEKHLKDSEITVHYFGQFTKKNKCGETALQQARPCGWLKSLGLSISTNQSVSISPKMAEAACQQEITTHYIHANVHHTNMQQQLKLQVQKSHYCECSIKQSTVQQSLLFHTLNVKLL